jgi:hypothetical protein
MNESQKRFVERLLVADRPSADARQRYEREMRTMFEKTLTGGERRGFLVCAVLMGLSATVCAVSALQQWLRPTEGGEFSMAYLGLTAAALVFAAGLSVQGYRKGVVRRPGSAEWPAAAGVAYVGLTGCLLLTTGETWPERLRDIVRVVGLVLLVYAAVAWVRHRVGQAERRTAEKLLEIELCLAEIGEALRARPGSADPATAQPPPPV